MAGLYEALIGSYGGQDDYLAEDPWYISGANIARNPLPKATSNSEAMWGPMLQGLLSGTLMGYGKQNAYESAFDAAKKSPLLNAFTQNVGPVADPTVYGKMLTYSGEDMPEGWTPKQAQGDLIFAALTEQNKKEEEQKKDEIKSRIIQSIANQDPQAGAKLLQQEYGVNIPNLPEIRPNALTASNRKLTEEERAVWSEKLDLKPEEQSILTTAGDLDRVMREKGQSGEKVRPPSPPETALITANDNFRERIKELKALAEASDDNSVVRATKGGKMLQWFGDTESPDYKLYSKLAGAKQEYAKAKLGSQVSDFDVRTWGPLFEGLPLLDSKKAIIDRLEDIEEGLKKSKVLTLDNLKKGLVNTSGFDEDRKTLELELMGASTIQERTLKDGTKVKVRKLPNGKWEEVS